MTTVAVIQARMGSKRLPGKVMLPLQGEPVLHRVITRAGSARTVDEVVVATSELTMDDVVVRCADRCGATVYRGSERDVLHRMWGAAAKADADRIVRITADCPLISAEVIDVVVGRLIDTGAEYCSNIVDRSFPRGLDAEGFTRESFDVVEDVASKPDHREHVTGYYLDHPERFESINVGSDDVFGEPWMQGRTDIRLTLDEAADYEVLRLIYENVYDSDSIGIRDAIRYVDREDLMQINEDVAQKSGRCAS